MFNITSLRADDDDNVVSIGWSYTTAAGSRGGTIKLPKPYGEVPLASITKATLLNWVDANLPEDVTNALDAQIAKDNVAAQIREIAVPD